MTSAHEVWTIRESSTVRVGTRREGGLIRDGERIKGMATRVQ